MPGSLALSYTTAQAVTLGLAAVLLVLLALLAYRKWKDSRVTPEERERRRRADLVAHGKLGDAVLVDVRPELLAYTYNVRGMEYTAWQDVSRLKKQMPQDLSSIGTVGVRYDPKNPANSIVLAEDWSGLR